MIQLLGNLSLILALIFSFLQGVLPLLGYYKKQPYLMAAARPGAYGQFTFVLIAYILLTAAFVTNDFSLAYVNANSHAALPLLYRLTAIWGAHEGSILLWIFILNIWTVLFAIFAAEYREIKILSLSILGLIGFCFLCFLILTSNPFVLNLDPMLGHDLNPLLQDLGFIFHPPMLYTGYVGFSVAFAITEAALIRGQLDHAWANLTRQFSLAAWCFLTLGITLGSWWAYRVLGWGGFWFWDPVENASLLPWLSGTALIHVILLVKQRETAKGWAALLALISFALSLLGTFLVRSGVLVSVHSFANDPMRGIFLLILLTILLTAALTVYLKRLPLFVSKTNIPFLLSRDTLLLLNSALLCLAMLTILLGTLYPLILDALHLSAISVGAPYFNLALTPLVLLTMGFMGLGPLLHHEKKPLHKFLRQIIKNSLTSLVIAAIVFWGVIGQMHVLAFISLTLSIWIIVSVKNSFRLAPGMSIAHLGFAMVIIGIMLSSLLSEELEARMHTGSSVHLGPYQFFFIDTRGIEGPNYRAIQANFHVMKQTKHIVNLYPEKRIYTIRDMVMTTPAIHPGIFRDLYIALGEPLNNNDWSVRIYYKPFMRWVWFGGMLMALGGVMSLYTRRNNSGKRN